MSLLHLVMQASIPVKIVMGLLLAASFMSWWYIFIKLFALKRAARDTNRFEAEFWGGADLNAVYHRVSDQPEKAGEMERVFEAGFSEFLKLRRQSGATVNVIMDGTRRAMRAAYQLPSNSESQLETTNQMACPTAKPKGIPPTAGGGAVTSPTQMPKVIRKTCVASAMKSPAKTGASRTRSRSQARVPYSFS